MFKKVIALVLVFVTFVQPVIAGGLIRKGQTFKATEDVRYFTMPEAKRLLDDLSKKDALEAQVAFLKNREAKYEGEIYVLRQAEEARHIAAESYKEAVFILKEATGELKQVSEAYKEVVLTQRSVVKTQAEQIETLQKRHRRNNIFTFLGGVLTTVAAGWAVGEVARGLKVRF